MELILEATAVIFANGETTEGTVAAARQAFPFEDARRRAKSTSVERERDLRPPRQALASAGQFSANEVLVGAPSQI